MESYKACDTVGDRSFVVKRSPSMSGRKSSKTIGNLVMRKNGLREAIKKNIQLLDDILAESKTVLPIVGSGKI